MNIFSHIRGTIETSIEALAASGTVPPNLDLSKIGVEPPRDPDHGDLSTNAAMVIAKGAGMKPRDLGELLAEGLKSNADISTADVAGPGFVNIRLEDNFWRARLGEILQAGTAYGASTIGAGQAVNVEYVSANPTGPMHVGHGRGAVVGDALAGLLAKAGFEVTREYYINDAGAQVDVLARSAHLRYREALGQEIGTIPDGLYPGEYLVDVGKVLAERDGARWLDADEDAWLAEFRGYCVDAMMDLIRDDLAALGVVHSAFTSEKGLADSGAIQEAVAWLEERDLVYTGVLEPPKGKLPDDWEERPQLLFKATEFGDDTDRPLRKSDESWTYFASDIAYHRDKFRRGFSTMVDVWGADHKGYVKRMQAAVKAVTEGKGTLDVRLCNLVNLMDDGQPVKMSKRSGSFVTLREVIDQVGKDAVRFIMLTRNNEALLDFDLKKVLEQSRDNPVFYVQYAHARICSVLRNAGDAFPDLSLDDSSLADADMGRLEHAGELAMIKLLAGWPRVVEGAALSHEPHRVAFYLTDLAAAFHGFWNRGNDNETLRFIVPGDRELTRARGGVGAVRGGGDSIRFGGHGRRTGRGDALMADQINVNAEDRPTVPEQAAKPTWGRRLLTLLIAMAAVGGFAVVVVYSYDKGKSSTSDAAAPVITAQEGPTKIKPKDPGGMVVPNRDKQVYGRLNVAERPDKIERLLPPPESVVEKPPAIAPPSNQVDLPSKAAEKSPEQMARSLAAIAPAAGDSKTPEPPAASDSASMAAKKSPPATESLMEEKQPEVAKLATPAKKRAVAAGPAFRVQLASVRSQKAAERAWSRYKKKHASLFGDLESKIVRVDLKGKGIYYRLQAGPLSDAKAARSLCSEAKKKKIGCIIVRP